MAFDKFKRILKALNVYGETARRMENPEPAKSPKSGTYTSAAEQDRMRNDLNAARENERYKGDLPDDRDLAKRKTTATRIRPTTNEAEAITQEFTEGLERFNRRRTNAEARRAMFGIRGKPK